MDSGIIISLILGVASIISSICFGLVPTIRKNKVEKLESKVKTMAKDIHFFYELESEYINELSTENEENRETLKKRKRSIISEKLGYKLSDYAKPSVTQKIVY